MAVIPNLKAMTKPAYRPWHEGVLVIQMESTASLYQLYQMCGKLADSLDLDRSAITADFIASQTSGEYYSQRASLVHKRKFVYLHTRNCMLSQQPRVDDPVPNVVHATFY